ncbi:MFS family permease [Nocardia sp. GAS34]|uniref:MFS transporter n=1 Tax=unclassified Nocardia TaxID=2637762 RepID=UPI003D229D27
MTSTTAELGRTTRSAGPGVWLGVGSIVLSSISAMTPVFGVAALATPIERDLHISSTGFGLMLSGFFAVSALGAPLARRLAGRIRVPLMLAGINGAALTALLLGALLPGIGALVAALLLAGAANALTQPAAGRYIAARVPSHRLSMAAGMLSAALGAAPLLPGVLAALVAQPLGWHAALGVAALLPLVSLLTTPLARLNQDRTTTSSPGTPQTAPVAPSARTNAILLLWTIAAGLATIGSNIAASYFVQLGTQSGLSTATAGLMQSMAAVVAVVVRLLVGVLADRAPRRNPAIVAAMMFSGAIGLALISMATIGTFTIGALLAVAGGWGWTGLLLAAIMRLLPGQGAKAGATVQIGLFGGAAVAPFAFGAASAAFGMATTVQLAAILVVIATGAMIVGARLQRNA